MRSEWVYVFTKYSIFNCENGHYFEEIFVAEKLVWVGLFEFTELGANNRVHCHLRSFSVFIQYQLFLDAVLGVWAAVLYQIKVRAYWFVVLRSHLRASMLGYQSQLNAPPV